MWPLTMVEVNFCNKLQILYSIRAIFSFQNLMGNNREIIAAFASSSCAALSLASQTLSPSLREIHSRIL